MLLAFNKKYFILSFGIKKAWFEFGRLRIAQLLQVLLLLLLQLLLVSHVDGWEEEKEEIDAEKKEKAAGRCLSASCGDGA